MSSRIHTLDQRIRLLSLALILFFVAVTFRLFYWQIFEGGKLRLSASLQHEDRRKIPAIRGDIVFADGSPLAQNRSAFVVFAEPQNIENKNQFAISVAPLLNKKIEEILLLVSKPDLRWVPLARSVDITTKQKLDSLHLVGLGFDTSSERYYPEASMAAHLLGFVGHDADGNDKGYFGLEGYYERELSGQNGSTRTEKDAKGAPILIGNSTIIPPQDGRTLVLSVDRSVQFIAEKRLKEGLAKYEAKEGSVIIIDPKTGGILGMTSFPNYDPSHFSDFDESLYTNPAVAGSYEPGSTFKPLVMAAAINENLITPNTQMNEKGQIPVGGYMIKTWNDQYHGVISMTQVLQYSSNVGMVFVQEKLGKDRTLRYIKEYGFGEKTNIDLEDESSPDLRAVNAWTDIDYATASFGQGIAATPLQVIRAMAAIANGGWLMEPKVVKEFEERNGKRTVINDRKLRRVFSDKTAGLVTGMMVDAVSYGEAKWAKPQGYRIAGKTGTAQIPVAGHYDKDKTIASFVGFAPAENPKFVMLVILQEPQSSIWGAETAAPLFFTIAKDLFAYYGIPPSP